MAANIDFPFGNVVVLTPEIAQWLLGDLNFKHIPFIGYTPLVRHRQLDFDTGAHLSNICRWVTVVCLRLATLDPVAPTDIRAQAVQD